MDMIAPLLGWIETHPTWAGVLVMLVAFSESLALVGLFLPGAAMMFGIGALVGTGTLPLWPTLVWAAVGAIAGDGISFWLGRRFHGQLRTIWPFRTHPELLENAGAYFEKHGGKSVLFGRFVGPMRPIIPAVAGMMDMPAGRFFIVNAVSGIFWAPVYVLPGMVFAATLGLAAEIATRLAVMGGFLLALLVGAFWLTRHMVRWLHPRTHAMISSALAWSARHPLAGHLPAAVLDPDHPEARGLTLLALVLVGAFALFIAILSALGGHGLLLNLDDYLHQTLQELRTPLMDHLLVGISELARGAVLLAVAAATLIWLGIRRHWQAAGHLLAVLAFAVIAGHGVDWLTDALRPDRSLRLAATDPQPLHSMALFGFMAVLIARELAPRLRWLAYAVAAALLSAIGFALVALGTVQFSDLLAGYSLGLAWVALVGIAYARHPAGHLSAAPLTALLLLTLAGGGLWQIDQRLLRDLQNAVPTPIIRPLPAAGWWEGGWAQLPAYREELRGKQRHPLDVQYAGPPATLQATLTAQGWKAPPPLNGITWLNWLNSRAPLTSVPLLPQVHAGNHPQLELIRTLPDGQTIALRLWPSHYRLGPDQPLWIGNVSGLTNSGIPGLTVPRTAATFDQPLATLKNDLHGWPLQTTKRSEQKPGWDGTVLLIRNPPGG